MTQHTTTQTQLDGQPTANSKTNIEILTGEGNTVEKKLRQRAKNAETPNTDTGEGTIEVL